MNVSKQTIDFIIAQEVTSKTAYNNKYAHPTWPGGQSGVTIGIGYDLGYYSRQTIEADWSILSPADKATLLTATGLKGDAAKKFLAEHPSLKAVVVPYETAVKVFIEKSLPKYAKDALKIYPGLDQLLPDAAGAIVSMIYNRGASLEGPRRVEMKNIKDLVAIKDYAGIADQIEASKHLWEHMNLDGLVTRRIAEAALVRNSNRVYAAADTIALNMPALA